MYKPEALHSSSYHIQTNKFEDESGLLRDKSASCSHGLELTQRPTTVIGISQNRLVNRQNSIKNAAQQDKGVVSGKKVMFEESNILLKNYYNTNLMKETRVAFLDGPKLNEEKSVSVNSLNSLSGGKDSIDFIDEAEDLTDRSNMLTKEEEDVKRSGEEQPKEKLFCSEFKDVHVHNIIKKFDEKITSQENVTSTTRTKIHNKIILTNPENMQNTSENHEIKPIIQEESESNVETNESVKYELGIPIIETRNTFIIAPTKEADVLTDVPPKPPPRTNYMDSYKPKYPADSPKPYIDPSKRQQPPPIQYKPEIVVQKPPLNIPSDSISSMNYHKAECPKPDIIEHVPDVISQTPPRNGGYKTAFDTPKISTSTPKSLTMSKVSPTNSIVRAMMYSNKSKNGKKKNTLTASRLF